MHPDGIEYFMEHFCHGLPTRFEDLGCDAIDAGKWAEGRLLPLGAGYFVYCGELVGERGIEVSAKVFFPTFPKTI